MSGGPITMNDKYIRWMKTAVVVPCVAPMLACTAVEGPTSWAQVGHLSGTIAAPEGSEEDGVSAHQDSAFFDAYEKSYRDDDNPELAVRYLVRGANLTRRTCFDYLEEMSNRDNATQAFQELLAITTVLTTGILGITGASSENFEGLALGSSFLLGGSEIYQNYYLLGPDSDVVVKLIKDAMEEAAGVMDLNPPATFDQAFSLLSDYSDLCTFSEIRRLVREAIGRANIAVDVRQTTQNNLVDALRLEISEHIGEPIITLDQMRGLYWKHLAGTQDAAAEAEADRLIAGLTAVDQPRLRGLQALLGRIPAVLRANWDSDFQAFSAPQTGQGEVSTASGETPEVRQLDPVDHAGGDTGRAGVGIGLNVFVE